MSLKSLKKRNMRGRGAAVRLSTAERLMKYLRWYDKNERLPASKRDAAWMRQVYGL